MRSYSSIRTECRSTGPPSKRLREPRRLTCGYCSLLGIGVNRLLTKSGDIPETWRRRLKMFARDLEDYYSHIRIDAKRQALDALDDLRRARVTVQTATGKPANDAAKSRRSWRCTDDLTSQSRHSLLLQRLAALR